MKYIITTSWFILLSLIFVAHSYSYDEDFKLYSPYDKHVPAFALIKFEKFSLIKPGTDEREAALLENIKTNAEKNLEIGKLKKEAAEHIFKAVEYAKEGNPDKQIEEYKLAIQLDPSYWMIDYYLARCCYRNGRYKDAIAYYSKLIELIPNYYDYYERRALAFTRIGLYSSALSDFSKAIELKPKVTYLYFNRGSVYGKYMKYDEAISEFSKAIEVGGDDPLSKKIIYFGFRNYLSYCYRGWAYFQSGKEEEAIKDLEKAIKLEPKFADSYIFLGKIYHKKINFRFTKYYYSKAIKLDPNNAEAYVLRGLLYKENGKNKKACKDFKKACDLGDCSMYEKAKNRGECE